MQTVYQSPAASAAATGSLMAPRPVALGTAWPAAMPHFVQPFSAPAPAASVPLPSIAAAGSGHFSTAAAPLPK